MDADAKAVMALRIGGAVDIVNRITDKPGIGADGGDHAHPAVMDAVVDGPDMVGLFVDDNALGGGVTVVVGLIASYYSISS